MLARCARCRQVIYRPNASLANRLTAAIALAALVLYPLGILLPVMRLEQLGHFRETSIWAGTVSLLTHNQIAVGLIVLVCSIVVPVCKLAGLLVLTARWPAIRIHHQARIYRLIENAGRWGMIDVLLVASGRERADAGHVGVVVEKPNGLGARSRDPTVMADPSTGFVVDAALGLHFVRLPRRYRTESRMDAGKEAQPRGRLGV